ncbi:MAG: decaprenyl-phosphate phosphoribosyltransferase [Candidatus Pacebacteria bacterium CG10_big_fil_rev_8_21_14_0_10_44_54]|nr:MAG: decaprenyl-phosphate phosphoribosyltransferase [Candidatus Pacebacteria bacterium CG10_big_fil_rev_8_21_14_0_10_44_54]
MDKDQKKYSEKNMTASLPKTLFLLLKTARPRQWVKNLSLFAALLFSGFLFYNPVDALPYFWTVALATLTFTLVTSAIYIANDLVDKKADAQHPFKRKRPIASGELSTEVAKLAVFSLLILAGFFSLYFSLFFKLLVLLYILLQIGYSKIFKHVPILDVASIALGFLIRIYAGSVVVNLHMSVWFLLTVISASLFLAVGKRQSERTLLMGNSSESIGSTRKILKRYSERLLDQYTAMFATATWLTYAIFTFQNEVIVPQSEFATIFRLLPKTLHTQKWLMISVPFVIFGVMRYLQLVYEKNQGESPERVLFNDKPLLITVFLFGLSVIFALYLLA